MDLCEGELLLVQEALRIPCLFSVFFSSKVFLSFFFFFTFVQDLHYFSLFFYKNMIPV